MHAAREIDHTRLSGDQVSHRIKAVARKISGVFKSGNKDEGIASAGISGLEGAYSPENPVPTADLGEIIGNVMSVYDARGAGRVSADGPTVHVPEHRVGMVGLCLHELATHALQQGAWSKEGGHIAIRWSCPEEGHVEIDWREHGGTSERAGAPRGLGLPLLTTLMEGIGGQLSFEAEETGAHMRLSLPIYAEESLELA